MHLSVCVDIVCACVCDARGTQSVLYCCGVQASAAVIDNIVFRGVGEHIMCCGGGGSAVALVGDDWGCSLCPSV